jgi:lipid II:glycine glycyltransferase (peptidoglycan interpeptide bridge formation enzyme)
MDLRPDLSDIFRSLHRDSAQRRIRHAAAAGLSCEGGRSPKLLKDFYDLMVLTRGRHHLPPQPFSWFRNLVDSMNEALEIRVAYKDQVPIGAILTMRFRDVVYYKYGCSDFKFKRFGAMPYLLWKTIEDSKSAGAKEFDLGRSDRDNATLVSFKNRWARQPVALTYWTYPEPSATRSWTMSLAKRMFAFMPDRLLAVTGRLIYRHIA